MGRFDYYKSGDWNAECDVCGQKYKASKLKLRWDGLRVCPNDFEFRHPQDFVRGIRDNPSTSFSRPEPPDTFIPFNWTQYPNEQLGLGEFVQKTVRKEVNFPSNISKSAIGGSALGILAVGVSIPYSLTSDDIAFTETITKSINKSNTESLSLSESISFTITTQTVLGGSALGTHQLGA